MNGRRARGFTLVELLVGTTLGLLVVGIICWLYVSSKQMARVNESVSRVEENGRFTIETLDTDLRMAGFRGCAGASIAPVNLLNSNAYSYQFANGLAGFHGNGAGFTPALDGAIGGLTPAPLPDSDVVTVRRIVGAGQQLTAAMTDGNAPLQLSPGSGFAAGDVLLAVDCTAAVVFQATSVNGAGAVGHDASGSPGNASGDLGHVFRTDATLYRLVTRTYYVAASVRKPGVTSIFVNDVPNYDGIAQPLELVEGVERMVLLFGEDLDGDRAANRYVTANAVTDWSNVVSVKPQVLLASTRDNVALSPQPYTFDGANATPTDRRLRSSLVSVVTLRNRVP